ncbi:MAG: phage replisome organizer N-terminal domain-containing protein [Clostridia bacterium]|nr:phage replisome organizer N-terminal domain-containing protein [Clostridia bacterium]
MATGKRYYWIKLKESFMTSDAVDFLMGQPDGANYVVLYQMLCLKTINTGGKLERHIGEIIIPYDEAKIQRDTKWFSIDTVRVALNLYKALGLIYQDQGGTLALADYENLVGSETDWAIKKRRQQMENSSPELPPTGGESGGENFPTDIETDIRDKEIREREQSSEQEKEDLTVSDETVCRPQDVRRVVESWNSLGLQNIRKVPSAESKTGAMLRARIREYGVDLVLEAVEKVRSSDFLMGKVNDFQATLDWFSRPNNFPKVINGNYDKHGQGQPQTQQAKDLKAKYGMMKEWADKHESE